MFLHKHTSPSSLASSSSTEMNGSTNDEETRRKILQLKDQLMYSAMNEEGEEGVEGSGGDTKSDEYDEQGGNMTTDQDEMMDRIEEKRKFTIKFRNYKPHDNRLKRHVMAPKIVVPHEKEDGEEQKARKRWATIEDQTEELLDQQLAPILKLSKKSNVHQNSDLNMLPQKMNWDLKRDVKKKLSILEQRTMKAISEMLKENMEEEDDEDDDEDDEEEDDDEDDDGDENDKSEEGEESDGDEIKKNDNNNNNNDDDDDNNNDEDNDEESEKDQNVEQMND